MIKQIQVNETLINYYNAGIGKPIIMLHGWGQSLASFEPIYKELEKEHEVFVLDLPGFGKSPECDHALDIFDYELVLYNFIKELKIIKPTIVGHSFGARIAIINAARNDNIDKLILTGAAGIVPNRSLKYYLSVYNYKFMKLLIKTPFYSQYKEDLLKQSGSEDYKNATPILKETLIKTVNEDLKQYIRDINCPTFLYWGELDEATPIADGRLMHELIKDSKLKICPRFGHFAYLENYQDFLEEIKQFLKEAK